MRRFPPVRQDALSVQARRYWSRRSQLPGFMESMQRARKQEPFFHRTETGDDFEAALRQAVRANTRSMEQLHDSIRNCMSSLRRDGMECEAALLTMKAFIRQLELKSKKLGSSEMMHSDMLMEQIVRWCIADFYIES